MRLQMRWCRLGKNPVTSLNIAVTSCAALAILSSSLSEYRPEDEFDEGLGCASSLWQQYECCDAQHFKKFSAAMQQKPNVITMLFICFFPNIFTWRIERAPDASADSHRHAAALRCACRTFLDKPSLPARPPRALRGTWPRLHPLIRRLAQTSVLV